MNLRDLKYLVTLADTLHFGKAAQECCISQPTLSMQIRKLEHYLGIHLFERNNKSIHLTNEGQAIIEIARQILRDTNEIRTIAKQAKDPLSQQLKLGFITTLGPYLLPLLMPQLKKHFPKLKIYLFEEKTNSLINDLMTGKLDAVLLTLPIEEKELTTVPLFKEEFLLAISKNHEWANRAILHATDIKQQSLLLLDEGHCLREQSLEFCAEPNAKDSENIAATSLETLRHMVAAGIGMTLVPKLACTKNRAIRYLPFKNPKPQRTIGLAYRKSSVKKEVLTAIASVIKEQFNKI